MLIIGSWGSGGFAGADLMVLRYCVYSARDRKLVLLRLCIDQIHSEECPGDFVAISTTNFPIFFVYTVLYTTAEDQTRLYTILVCSIPKWSLLQYVEATTFKKFVYLISFVYRL
ncbi:hypothetical protein CH362_13370 [Leptospira saintgironsiae]|uniref:Uncharacterized protein n=1 Tax=Leptospira saintgironsiae TaxID=2023183 RepID=A0A2M9YAZ2_9LEPT|nr:hypothetical protein CH362_13370 [Leptospira saintgironsiae]